MRILTLTAMTLLAMACGRVDDTVASSRLAGLQANLRFVGTTINVATSSGSLVPLDKGGTLTVACNQTGLRAQYRYGNGGPVGAGAHSNVSLTSGGPSFTFAQLPLASGAIRSAWASFTIPTPNVATLIGIRLDGLGAVAESNELDNAWVGYVVRKCP
jgi:hypothetical protein